MSGQGFDDLDDVARATHSVVIGKILEIWGRRGLWGHVPPRILLNKEVPFLLE